MGHYASEMPDPYEKLNSKGQPADHPGEERTFSEHRNLVNSILDEVRDQVKLAMIKHAPMHSPHEGHSVIREEFDELWDHVKADTGRSPEARKEALQLAATAIRYVVDLIDERS